MSHETEQSVIGGLVLLEGQGKQADKAFSVLESSHFACPAHKSIYSATKTLADRGDSVDVITIDAMLSRDQCYQDFGGLSYLVELTRNTPSASNLSQYVSIVRENAIERFAGKKLNEALASLHDPEGGDVYQKLGAIESIISEINDKGMNESGGLRHIMEHGKNWMDNLDRTHNDPDYRPGYTTGISGLDVLLRPKYIPAGSLVVVGARPKKGKTALLTMIADHYSCELNVGAAVFSLEMPGDQVFERAVVSHGRIDPLDIYTQTSGPAYEKLHDACGRMQTSKMFVDDTPGMSLEHIKRESRKLHKKEPLGLIAVDYLTLMEAEKAERNDLAYGKITKGLKNLAKELNCVVLLLTQLNRNLEQRPLKDRKPMPSDSRDTGQIEQDCDVWIGLFRLGVYSDDCPHPSLTEGIVRLNRHGKTGSFWLDLREGYFVPLSFEEGQRLDDENWPQAKPKAKVNF